MHLIMYSLTYICFDEYLQDLDQMKLRYHDQEHFEAIGKDNC